MVKRVHPDDRLDKLDVIIRALQNDNKNFRVLVTTMNTQIQQLIGTVNKQAEAINRLRT